MPITYVTAPPGSGKTLWTIQQVEALRVKTGRDVYQWGIPDLTLPWKPIDDPQKVHDLPQGAIIVVDEAHKIWPQRSYRIVTPPTVAAFDFHRKRGHDFYILTQRPTAVDHELRGHVDRHVHLVRKFGVAKATVYSWEGRVELKPADRGPQHSAQKTQFAFPASLYSVYKSADMHTIKARPPWLKIGLALLPVIGLAIFVPRSLSALSNFGSGPKAPTVDPVASPASAASASPAAAATTDADRWAANWTPRFPGAPYSAPIYDALYRPATIPRISGCLELRMPRRYTCKCTTQQGTTIEGIDRAMCRYYLANGWFDPTKADVATAATSAGPSAPYPSDMSGAPPKPGGLLDALEGKVQ